MTYQEAQAIAVQFGAKPCRFTAPHKGQEATRQGEVVQCWTDRIEMLPMAAVHASHHTEKQHLTQLAEAIAEANRYA